MLAAIVQDAGSPHNEAPSLFAMAACYLILAVAGIFWPEILRNGLSRLMVAQKRNSWLEGEKPLKAIRWIAGVAGVAGAALFAYMATRTFGQR